MKTDLPTADEPRPDRCETCRFSEEGRNGSVSYTDCRRHAPTRTESNVCMWPRVFPWEWCGEWKAKGYMRADGIVLPPPVPPPSISPGPPQSNLLPC